MAKTAPSGSPPIVGSSWMLPFLQITGLICKTWGVIDAGDANALECGLDLLFQHRRQVQWLATLELFRSKDEVFRSVAKTL